MLLAICGDESINDTCPRWSKLWTNGGTTGLRFLEFIEEINADLDVRYPGRSFVFTMDNLNSHKHPLVLHSILNAGHRYAFRAPYWLVDGSIEYVFNTIQTHLQVFCHRLHTMEDLENRINLIIGSIRSFHRYFTHVGFPV